MRRALALTIATLAVLVATGTPASGSGSVYHERVIAGAEVVYSTCRWEQGGIPVGGVCTDTYVLVYQAQAIYTPDQVHLVGQQPWVAFVWEDTYRYDGNDTFTDLYFRIGETAAADINVDVSRLLTAHATALVPMDDGTQLALDLDWDMAGTQLHTAGTDGPGAIFSGWQTHQRTGCSMTNQMAHQTWRSNGIVTGTLGGVDVNSLYLDPTEPFLGRSVFTVTSSTHGACLG